MRNFTYTCWVWFFGVFWQHRVVKGAMDKRKLSWPLSVGLHPSHKHSSYASTTQLVRAMASGSSSTWNHAAPTTSDHILNCVSCFLLKKGRELCGPMQATDFDFLDCLPEKLHAHLHKREAFVSSVYLNSYSHSSFCIIFQAQQFDDDDVL